MRDLLILGGIGILSAATWTGATAQDGRGSVSTHGLGAHGRGGLEGRMRHGEGYIDRVGRSATIIVYPFQLLPLQPEPGPAPEMFTSGLAEGGQEHLEAIHPAGPATHPTAHVPIRVERGEPVTPQPTVPGDAVSGRDGAVAAQPNPTVRRWLTRSPGAVGPGRLASGMSGPGRPGPGRPASPRW